MNEELLYIELIEAYCEKRLSAAELADFEERLLVDNKLQQELDLYRKVILTFNDIEVEKVRANLRTIDAEMDSLSPKNRSLGYTKYFMVAAMLIVVAGIFFYLFLNQNKSVAFDEKYIPVEEGLPVLMSSSGTKEFDNAMSAFKNSEFKISEKDFRNMLKIKPGNDTLIYFLANSLIRQGEYNQAVKLFETLTNQPISVYYQKAKFYTATCYWANGNNKKAIMLFTEISSNQQNIFSKEATDINSLLKGK